MQTQIIVGIIGQTMDSKSIPQIKFYKDAAPDILSGKKTLEPRPRSTRWIGKISEAKYVNFTYGPRIGTPKIFARAEILNVETRPFESIRPKDLTKVGLGWKNKTPHEFIEEYKKWFSKELKRGYPVAWIYFRIVKKYE